jgi:hypothetical protein
VSILVLFPFLCLFVSSVHFLVFCFIYLRVTLFLLFPSLTQFFFLRHFVALSLEHSLYCQFTSILLHFLSHIFVSFPPFFLSFLFVSIFYVSTCIPLFSTHVLPLALCSPHRSSCSLTFNSWVLSIHYHLLSAFYWAARYIFSRPTAPTASSIWLRLTFQTKNSNLSFLNPSARWNHVPVSSLLSSYFLIGLGFLCWSYTIPQAFDLKPPPFSLVQL